MEQTGLAETLYKRVAQQLKELYPPEEAAAVSMALLCTICGMSRSEWYLRRTEYRLTRAQYERFVVAEERLYRGEPLQYVLGEAPFGPLTLAVGQGVLIPRPETEELCSRIVAEHIGRTSLRILDLGTGSAAIPLYLAYSLKNSLVYGVEKSSAALGYARTNAARYEETLQGSVQLMEGDMTKPATFLPQIDPLDILVSNPPYVTAAERAGLAKHVLLHEPEEALFAAPHEDDLYYYRAIAALLPLLPKRFPFSLYLEINPLLAEETRALFLTLACFDSLEIVEDLFGKQRFLVGAIAAQ